MSEPGPPRPPAGTSRYTWVVGALALVAIAYITLNTLGTEAPGSRGVPKGERLPPFAVPLATSKRKGDAQVDPAKACRVRGPVVLAFFATRSDRCEDQVDVLERVRRRYPDVGFAAVSVRGKRGDVRDVVRERTWGMPVGYDHAGAVSNAYAVAIC